MQPEITIRTMQETDAAVVSALTKQLGYNNTIEQTKSNIEAIESNPYCEAFVAVLNNAVIGWITVASVVTLESAPYCEVRGLVVDEQFRNKQTGKMLVEKTKQWCRDKHCKRLRVRCNIIRKETHAFYHHLGFAEKKEQKVFEVYV